MNISQRKFGLVLGMSLTALMALGLTGCKTSRRSAFRWDHIEGTVRVACIGDSITYGAGVEGRETNCYPAVLGKLMGSKFEVKNFGVSGATLLKKGDKPYWTQPEFNQASAYGPHLVIIKLGTNDTKEQNWKHGAEFEANLKEMIEHFARLPSHPKVWVCFPVPVYETQWGINDDTLAHGVIPAVKRAAHQSHAPIIDLYEALSNRPDLFPDKVHPNAAGAQLIARTIESALFLR